MEEWNNKEDSCEGSKIRVAVYDADFLPYYVVHNKKDNEYKKTLEDCIILCDEFIANVNRLVKADYYIGYLTVGKCFRFRVNPSYKVNRKYENQPDYLKEVKQHLIDKHGFKWDEEYEADDLVLSYKAQNKQYECIIISPDKDILNSVDICYNPRRNEFKYNSSSYIIEYFWKSMICGDTIDGIKGIPGKGIKHAESRLSIYDYCEFPQVILREYIDYFGEYEGIKEFTKNYLSLKLIDNIKLEDIKLNKVEKQISL